MRDFLSWKLPLGRLLGVRVSVHALFPLAGVLAWQLAAGSDRELGWYIALACIVLFFSVLLHEMAHCFVARRHGSRADEILLWPLGGLTSFTVPVESQVEVAVASAGPLLNLCVCCLCAPALAWTGASLGQLINPFAPPAPADAVFADDVLKLTFWINWVLALVNLLPASPLDGGRVFRALMWQTQGFRSTAVRVAQLAKLVAVVLVVLALGVHNVYPFAVFPLTLLACVVFFSAQQEVDRFRGAQPAREPAISYDFSSGFAGLQNAGETESEARTGPVRQWLEQRRQAKLRRQRELEAEEERRLDEVLARVQQTGLAGLSPFERSLLDRVSARFRDRQRR